ncbi:HIT-like domain-containing protein [Kockiozyma suomiensis]|uniref:HIT-like domain-containing protein n=1 Tax=Kockiozyma suomiensis TaxID=1337062 RepID=UPI0033435B19
MAQMENRTELIRLFKFERVLNHDVKTKMIYLLGEINLESAIIIAEKTAFDVDNMEKLTSTGVIGARLLDENDIYRWFMVTLQQDVESAPAAKLSIIWPATQTHIAKYSIPRRRMITETPAMYKSIHLPYIEKMRGSRIQWVYNILEHKVETDRIVYENSDSLEGFILLPDLKWDRTTMDSLYLVAIVHRHDIFSVRSLNKTHIPWLKKVRKEIITNVAATYCDIHPSQLRLYVHYLPSYYHFHIHVTNVQYDAGDGTAIGKAIMLNDVISRLEEMSTESAGFENSILSFLLAENSELWTGFESLADDI